MIIFIYLEYKVTSYLLRYSPRLNESMKCTGNLQEERGSKPTQLEVNVLIKVTGRLGLEPTTIRATQAQLQCSNRMRYGYIRVPRIEVFTPNPLTKERRQFPAPIHFLTLKGFQISQCSLEHRYITSIR